MADTTSTASIYSNTYTTFSGCDIACSFGSQIIGELQGISYSVTREKAPIYTMGSANPRSFSRGKRGIAGTLVFVMFDHDALLKGLAEHINNTKGLFHRIGGDANWEALSIDEWDEQLGRIASGGSSSGSNNATRASDATKSLANESATIQIADEIPPFDITISMANEYGKAAVMVLYGVEILNQGSQFSMDNIQSQQACTFVARKLKCLEAVALS